MYFIIEYNSEGEMTGIVDYAPFECLQDAMESVQDLVEGFAEEEEEYEGGDVNEHLHELSEIFGVAKLAPIEV